MRTKRGGASKINYLNIVDDALQRVRPFPARMTIVERLRQSIIKWQMIRKYYAKRGKGLYIDSVGTCALCDKYVSRHGFCGRCPVARQTGRMFCEGTPAARFGHTAKQAQQEIVFLQKLLLTHRSKEKS